MFLKDIKREDKLLPPLEKSPDLNHIEKLWSELKKTAHKGGPWIWRMWKDSVLRCGLRFIALYSSISSSIISGDSTGMLAKHKVLSAKVPLNCTTCCFVKISFFLVELKAEFLLYVQVISDN